MTSFCLYLAFDLSASIILSVIYVGDTTHQSYIRSQYIAVIPASPPTKKMLESRPEDALVKLVKTVEMTDTVETVETVKNMEIVKTIDCGDCRDCRDFID